MSTLEKTVKLVPVSVIKLVKLGNTLTLTILGFFICLSYRELHALNTVHLITKPQFSQFYDKIPVRTLLDVLFPVFRFSEASFNAPTSALIAF